MSVGDAGHTWFRRFRPVQAPRLRLLCLAHAGGGPSLYRGWPRHLPPDVEALVVRYPGRQDRIHEPCIATMDEMVDHIVTALQPFLDDPLAVFGHSMGALIGYEVAGALQRHHGRQVAALLVSGALPPHRGVRKDAHLHGDDALIEEVRRLGDGDPNVLDDPDLRELFLPALRTDFALVYDYSPGDPFPLDTEVRVYAGNDDPDVPPALLQHWGEVSRRDASVRVFPGDHFYLVTHEQDVVTDVGAQLSLLGAPGHPLS